MSDLAPKTSQQPGKSAGQLAYERDLERTPRYQNGKEHGTS